MFKYTSEELREMIMEYGPSEEVLIEIFNESLIAATKGSKIDKYNYLHTINQSFVKDASMETYILGVQVMSEFINGATDTDLQDKKKPLRQMIEYIVNRVDGVLHHCGSSVFAVWAASFMVEGKENRARVEKYLKEFITLTNPS